MRTVHCSDRLVGRGGEVVCRGVSKWVSAVYLGVFAQRGCLPMGAGGVHPPGQTPPPDPEADTPFPPGPRGRHSPIDRIIDTRLWKHYLSATIVADGKKYLCASNLIKNR